MLLAEGELGIVWILGLLAGAGAVIAALFKMLVTAHKEKYELLLAEKDRQNKELEASRKSLKEIASEAVKSYLNTANHYRQKEGQPPIVPLAPVVPEAHSPPTKEQREAAEIATMRARMAQINLATGIEPRQEQPAAGELAPDTIEDATLATRGDITRLEGTIAAVPEKVAERLEEKDPSP
jgi:hypothetical protein